MCIEFRGLASEALALFRPAALFGLRPPGLLLGRRGLPGPVPFVIGPDLRIIAVIRSEVRMSLHADRALEVLKAAQPA